MSRADEPSENEELSGLQPSVPSPTGVPPTRLQATFRSLRVRNFRLFLVGQLVSGTGMWMHYLGVAWLVLELGGSGTAVGFASGLGFVPMLVLGPWAGLVADRRDKRRLLLGAQILLSAVALVLGVLVALGVVRLWMVFVLAVAFGIGTAFENPTRRSIIAELVGRGDITNAVSLTSSLLAITRALGPMLGGAIIAGFGTAPVFLTNALTYGAMIYALVAMDPLAIQRPERVARGRGQLREGLRYARRERRAGLPLLLVAIVGTLAFNNPVVIPLMATRVFDRGAAELGLMMGLVSIGSVVGALIVASRLDVSYRYLAVGTLLFGVAILAAAFAPWIALFLPLLVLVGIGATSFTAVSNGLLQRDTAPKLLGRIMALFSVAFLGSTAIGGPLIGFVSEATDPRLGFATGGVAAVLCGLYALRAARDPRLRPARADEGAAPA